MDSRKKSFSLLRVWFLAILLGLTGLSSCSHFHSGHYIQLEKNEDPKELAEKYNIPIWSIHQANTGKKFVGGEWIFIPLRRGVLNHFFGRLGSSEDPHVMAKSFSDGKFLWPVPSSKRISSHYGKRWGRQHEGIDIAAKKGSHILSIDDGVVIYSGSGLGGYGNITVIAHYNGYFSVYAHAHKNFTKNGQKVHRGQVIATVGKTGRATGPHLHFEIRRNSRAINPKVFYTKR